MEHKPRHAFYQCVSLPFTISPLYFRWKLMPLDVRHGYGVGMLLLMGNAWWQSLLLNYKHHFLTISTATYITETDFLCLNTITGKPGSVPHAQQEKDSQWFVGSICDLLWLLPDTLGSQTRYTTYSKIVLGSQTRYTTYSRIPWVVRPGILLTVR